MQMILRQATLIGKLRYYFLDRYQSRTVRFSLIGLCLSMTLLTTLLWKDLDIGGNPIPGLVPILLLAGIGFLTIAYTNMERFAVIVILVTTLLSDGISTGTDTKIMFSFVLLWLWMGLWIFKMVVVDRKLTLKPSPANIPIFAFILVVIISLVWSSNFAEITVTYLLADKINVRLMTALVMIISALTYLLYANHVKSLRTIRFIMWWFIGVGAVFLVLRLGAGQVSSPFNAKGQFPTWVTIFALSQILFNPDLKRWLRLLLGVIILGWVYVTMTLGLSWLSGWMPLLFGCLILFFLYSRKLFILLVVAATVVLLANQLVVQSTFDSENEESGGTRQEAWQRVFDVTARHPVFGTGPAGYHFYFSTTLSGLFQLAHNNYVDIIGQLGLVGITVWLILWGCIGVMTWRMYRLVPKGGGGFRHGMANALAASYLCTILTMMLGDWITPFPYTQTLAGVDYTIWAWIWPGITAALYYITRDELAAEAVSTETTQQITRQPSI